MSVPHYMRSLDISIISLSVRGAVQSALCCCNHRFVLDLWLCFCLNVSVLFMLLRLPQTLHCDSPQKFMSHSVTLEWQLEKVINVLTQWWPCCQLSNAIRSKNVAFVIRKRLNRVTQFVSLMKRQRSTFSFCSSKREGKNKEHVRSRWTQVVYSPHFLHVSETNHFTLRRRNNINIYVRIVKWKFQISLFCDQTAVTVCRGWITFTLYCAISKAPDHREIPRVPWYIWFGSVSIDRATSLSRAVFNGIKEKRREMGGWNCKDKLNIQCQRSRSNWANRIQQSSSFDLQPNWIITWKIILSML